MAQDFSKIKLGACKVTYDVGGATPLVIESTIGGVTLNLKQTSIDVKTDQTGDTIVKKIKNAVECTVDVPIAEYDLSTIAKMIPGATLTVNGTDPSKKKVIVDGTSGVDLFAYAKKVKLEPLNGTTADTVILYKAAPEPDFKFSYKHDGERITNVTFVGFPDSTTTPPNGVVLFGDELA